MRIPCPFCGLRDISEFSYLGDADAPREKTSVEAVFSRKNPAGRHREYWHHGAGCRLWLVVTRDTRTHEIFSAEMPAAGAGAP